MTVFEKNNDSDDISIDEDQSMITRLTSQPSIMQGGGILRDY